MTSLSVVVLAYNEEGNLEKCFNTLLPVLKKLKREFEIIIVDDGSKDSTGQIADKLSEKNAVIRVIHNKPNKGYGGAWKTGALAAKNDIVVMTHADNQFDFSEVSRLLAKLEEEDCDLVSGIRVEDSDPVHRRFFRWGWNTLVRALFGYLATDVDCGFKVFKRKALERVSIPSNGAMLDTQLYAGMRARNMKIEELPVKHLPRTAGKSTGGNPKVILKALKELVFFWWQLKQEIMVEQGRAVFKWEALAILAIVMIASFLRLYKIDQYMTFLGDEGRDVMIVRDMLQGKNFPLIGPGTSIGNMYLGPWYYYLMAPGLWIADFSPVGPAVTVALIGVATVWLIWWIGRQWFGRIEAVVISTLYAISPVIITYSRSSWNPNVMPFFALLCVYGLWKVWRFGYGRWLVISAICFGFALNSHYLGLLLLPLFGVVLFKFPKRPDFKKHIWAAVAAFAIMMLPLVIFDLNPSHPLQNFNSFKKFFTERQTTVNLKFYKAIPNIWPVSSQIFGSIFTGGNQLWAGVVIAIALLGTVIKIYKKDWNREFLLVLAWVGIGVLGLGLYKQHIYDHYFGFLYPGLFLLIGFVLNVLKKWSIPLVLLIGFWSIYASPLRFAPNNQLQRTQTVAEFVMQASGGQAYNLALLAKRNYDRSYVYFLKSETNGLRTIHEQLTDQLFVICEDADCQPINSPMWEVAAFGWAKIENVQEFPWGVKVYKLVHNPTGKI